jgi:hypothetical protein
VAKARCSGACCIKVLLALAAGDAAGPRPQAAGVLRNIAADAAVGVQVTSRCGACLLAWLCSGSPG